MSDWPPDTEREKFCAESGLLISSTNESHLLWAFSMEEKYSLKRTTFMNGRNYPPLSLFFPLFLFLPEVAAFGHLVEQQ